MRPIMKLRDLRIIPAFIPKTRAIGDLGEDKFDRDLFGPLCATFKSLKTNRKIKERIP